MTSITRIFVISKKNLIFFVIWFLFEILSLYRRIGSSHLLKKDIRWIIDKVSGEKKFGFIGFGTSLLHFLSLFFIIIGLIAISY